MIVQKHPKLNGLKSSSVQLWLRADKGITLDGSGNVSDWQDQSGKGNHATQATAADRPTFVANACAGLPVVRATATNQWLQIAHNAGLEFNGTGCVIMGVFRSNSASTAKGAGLVGKWGSVGGVWAMLCNAVGSSTTASVSFVDGTGVTRTSTTSGDSTNDVYFLHVMTLASSATGTCTSRKNRTAATSSAAGASGKASQPTVPVSLFRWQYDDATTSAATGDIAELVVLNTVNTNNDIRIWEAYFLEKYAAPPANAVLHLSAQRGIELDSSSGKIAKWWDYSGNDNHATQTTAANQFSLATSIIATGKSVVRSGGSPAYMRIPHSTALEPGTAFTVGTLNYGAIVTTNIGLISKWDQTTPANAVWRFMINGAGGGAGYFAISETGTDTERQIATTTDMSSSVPRWAISMWDGTNIQVHTETSVSGTTAVAGAKSVPGTELRLMMRSLTDGYAATDVCEVLVWNRVLSADERATLAFYFDGLYSQI